MIDTIKNYALAALAVVTGILAALWQYQKAKFAKAKLKGVEEAREVEQKANEGMINDINKENKVSGSIDDGKFLD